jgi:hypothetical protein
LRPMVEPLSGRGPARCGAVGRPTHAHACDPPRAVGPAPAGRAAPPRSGPGRRQTRGVQACARAPEHRTRASRVRHALRVPTSPWTKISTRPGRPRDAPPPRRGSTTADASPRLGSQGTSEPRRIRAHDQGGSNAEAESASLSPRGGVRAQPIR